MPTALPHTKASGHDDDTVGGVAIVPPARRHLDRRLRMNAREADGDTEADQRGAEHERHHLITPMASTIVFMYTPAKGEPAAVSAPPTMASAGSVWKGGWSVRTLSVIPTPRHGSVEGRRLGGRLGVPRQADEQLVAPAHHLRLSRRDESLAPTMRRLPADVGEKRSRPVFLRRRLQRCTGPPGIVFHWIRPGAPP